MAKKVLTLIKLQIPAGAANPAPPVGPALGQHGVNIMEFCKAFNARTQQDAGTIIPVEITVYEDRSFDFITKTPPAAVLIREALGIEKGSGEPNREKVGRLTRDQCRQIAERKMPDLNANDLDAASKIIAGTARSMGVDGRGDRGLGDGAQPRQALPRGDRAGRPHRGLPARRGGRAGQARPPSTKFDETVEVHMRLGVNVRHAEEQLRGTLALPHGLGKEITVAVFAEGDAARAATEAGADHVGAADLAERVEEGWTDFDVAIATPALMGPVVSKLGRVLGPQGKMPNPKVGTVTDDVGKAVTEAKAGKVEYRTDRSGDHPPDDRQGELPRAGAARELRRDPRRDRARQARRREGPLPALDHAGDDDGPGRPRRHHPHPRVGDPRRRAVGQRRRGRGAERPRPSRPTA